MSFFDANSPEEYYSDLQKHINDGTVWSFEGSVGRAAMNAIHLGCCLLGPQRARDYWGNTIPSRDDVVPGTPGSAMYVSEKQGNEWLALIAPELALEAA